MLNKIEVDTSLSEYVAFTGSPYPASGFYYVMVFK